MSLKDSTIGKSLANKTEEKREQFMEGTSGNILVSSTMTTPTGRSMQLPLLHQDLSSGDVFSQSKASWEQWVPTQCPASQGDIVAATHTCAVITKAH